MSKNNKRAPKATNLIKVARLQQVIDMRAKGMFRFEAINILTKEWGMKESGVEIYWAATTKLLKESFTDEDLLSRYNRIFTNTMDESPAIALKALDSIAKLKAGNLGGAEVIIRVERDEE
jgi:hypothetical protein